MGVRILGDYKRAVMYCSTTDWAFGPVFSDDDEHDADERIHAFLRWLKVDPRTFEDAELESKYCEWRSQEKAQWKAEKLQQELEWSQE